MNPSRGPEPNQADMSREERFEAAYRRLYAPVCGYVLRRVSTPDAAAEAVAEIFLTLWRRLDNAPSDDAIRPWTYGIARRVIANHLRGERRRHALSERLANDLARVSQASSDPADAVAARSELREAMAALSESDREVLRLTAWEGLTTDELAVALGVRSAAARLRLHRARRRLQSALNERQAAKQHSAAGQVSEQRETTSHSRIAEGAS